MTRSRLRRAVRLCAASAAAGALLAPASFGATGPTPTAVPTIAGVLQQGKRLTATAGDWLGAGAISYAYQWHRCDAHGAHCSSIHGSTASTYTEVAQDVGRSLAVTVRATDGTGTTPAYSSLAGLVAPSASLLSAAKQPVLAGDAIVGHTLSATGGSWLGRATSSAYAWLRCNANGRACSTIAGATASTYAVTATDAGHRLLAAVSGATGTTRRTALSLASAPVRAQPAPLNAEPPSVTGTLRVGQRLTATPGTWFGSGAIAYAYQWYRCDDRAAHCSAIGGATKRTYTEVARDAGRTLALTVRASDATGHANAYSSAAGVVARASSPLAVTAQAAPAGSATVGGSLEAAPPTWSGAVAKSATTWLRCNAHGRACVPIARAAGTAYAPTRADAGHRLVAEVRATAGGSALTALSLASPVIGA